MMTHHASKGLPISITTFLGVSLHLALTATPCFAAESANSASPISTETTSLLSAIIKVSGSLLVVVGIMLILLYAIKRSGLGSGLGRGSSAITVLETRMVAPKKYIAIVDVAGHCLALGITDHNINLLSDLGSETTATLTSRPVMTNTGFAGLLKKSIRTQQATTAQSNSDAAPHPNTSQESP